MFIILKQETQVSGAVTRKEKQTGFKRMNPGPPGPDRRRAKIMRGLLEARS